MWDSQLLAVLTPIVKIFNTLLWAPGPPEKKKTPETEFFCPPKDEELAFGCCSVFARFVCLTVTQSYFCIKQSKRTRKGQDIIYLIDECGLALCFCLVKFH